MLRRICSSIILIVVSMWFSIGNAVENTTISSVVILPFDVSAAGKYSSLEPGLRNMLISRLSKRDRIRIIEPNTTNVDLKHLSLNRDGVGVFTELKTDYLASGALFGMENGLKIQMVFHPKDQESDPVKLSVLSRGEEKIFEAVDELSQEVAEKVFGYEAVKAEKVSSSLHQEVGFRTDHPDRKYKKGVVLSDSKKESGKNYIIKGVKKSKKVSLEIVSMAVGDLENDGLKETILVGNGSMKVFTFNKGVFTLVHTLSLPKSLRVHAVNVADLNRNGFKEIYISATDGYNASSLIIEWNTKNKKKIQHKNISWYIRPIFYPGKGNILAGQATGFKQIEAVTSGIYHLEFHSDGKRLIAKEKLSLPAKVNLFDFVFADVDGDGMYEKVVLSHLEKLLVYDQANQIQWVSDNDYGGSKLYFGPQWGSHSYSNQPSGLGTADEYERELVFIPTRILAVDINNDKKNEILIGSNKLISYKFFENLRSYDGGYVSLLSWQEESMVELLRTNRINGYIADYNLINDTEKPSEGSEQEKEDGQSLSKRLMLVAEVPETGITEMLFGGDFKSRLLSYEIDFRQVEKKSKKQSE